MTLSSFDVGLVPSLSGSIIRTEPVIDTRAIYSPQTTQWDQNAFANKRCLDRHTHPHNKPYIARHRHGCVIEYQRLSGLLNKRLNKQAHSIPIKDCLHRVGWSLWALRRGYLRTVLVRRKSLGSPKHVRM